ncbi:MAG: xylulokinase [Desulfosarcinaceae bacterium]
MPRDQLCIGIDSGTQGTKGVVLSRRQRQIIASAHAAHQIIETPRGGREQQPEWWTAALEQAMETVLGSPDVDGASIMAIGVSGQQHGLVALDAQGGVIRPAKLWCDTETTPQCHTLTERVGGPEAVVNAIGNQIAAGFTASKILWLKEKEPKNYARLHTLLLPHDYLNYWLTGERKTEYGDASGTAYFDIRKRRWSEALLTAVDSSGRLNNCLPELMAPTDACGQLLDQRAAAWGVPKGVLVSVGGGDNMMAAIGTGNVRPGVLTASLGTSGTIYAYSDTPVVDQQGELAAFCSSSGGWLPLVCTMNVTVATELFRRLLKFDLKQFNERAAQAPLGAGGLLLLPFFNGERTPALPEATACLNGMTSLNLTSANLCRAAMEGATLGLRYGLDVMLRNGIRPTEIRLVGGGAQSPVWRQLVADLFNLPVVSPVSTEAGALGAALQALWCYGNQREGETSLVDLCADFIRLDENTRTQPNEEAASFYGDLYQRYLTLDDTMRRLNR